MKRILALLSSLIFIIACGDDSSSAFDALSENQSSSSVWIVTTSSSSWQAPSSSSRNDVKNSSSSISVKSSSSSAKRLSGEVSGDPLQIFKTRVPKKAVYHCDLTQEIGGFEGDFDQKDWICSFKYAGMEGYVYAQSSPTGCTAQWGFYPEIGVDSAVLYVNGKYETLNGVTYDWGGNHHNDSFRFSYDGKVFEYSRSSIDGFAFRPCQEMDCLKVYEADGTTLIEDGCNFNSDDLSKVRQLPIVCRFANLEDGSFGDFTDNFEFCSGDHRLNK
ncbi:MAG: hypothetical protein J6W51_00870 [Fibrobacter sp.]|nr:hypothetical protein [Fibrobacter sp.]MBP5767658.1 hypothetical protein [Fibrobacter sp.]